MLTNALMGYGNAKVGKTMPTISRGQDTCPPACPFLNNGCYGDGRHWGAVNKFVRETIGHDVAVAHVAKGVRRGSKYVRDRVLGDIYSADGTPDVAHILAVADVAREVSATVGPVKAYGYTHMWSDLTVADVAAVAESGYVLNASVETIAQAETAIVLLGMPTVIASDDIADGTMIAGKRVITCPEMSGAAPSCEACGLCMRGADRKYVVRFPLHGATVGKARRAVAAANA